MYESRVDYFIITARYETLLPMLTDFILSKSISVLSVYNYVWNCGTPAKQVISSVGTISHILMTLDTYYISEV